MEISEYKNLYKLGGVISFKTLCKDFEILENCLWISLRFYNIIAMYNNQIEASDHCTHSYIAS